MEQTVGELLADFERKGKRQTYRGGKLHITDEG